MVASQTIREGIEQWQPARPGRTQECIAGDWQYEALCSVHNPIRCDATKLWLDQEAAVRRFVDEFNCFLHEATLPRGHHLNYRQHNAAVSNRPSIMNAPRANLFARRHALIGMVHLRALPGAPSNSLSPAVIVAKAVDEARQLAAAGFDALIVENMHDRPYLADASGADTVATFAIATAAVVEAVQIPVGVQILSGANGAALAVAHAAGAAFIRAEGFVFAAVADEGLLARACAGELLRERKRLGAEDIRIFADVRKKHSSHALTADLDMGSWVRAAEFFSCDGVIVTGTETGVEPNEAELAAARVATSLPVLVGSGATPANLARIFEHAHGVIVGSALKVDGMWMNELDATRIRAIVAARDAIR